MSKRYGNLDTGGASDDNTEVSDVDPDEMEKMLQDMDDLDSNLFSSSREVHSKRPIKSVLHSSKDTVDKPKPHVSFVDTDIDFDDDPLEDLLSIDNGTRDKKNLSLFKNENTSIKTPEKKSKSSMIAELFGTADEEKTSVNEPSDWLGLKPVESLEKTNSEGSPLKESNAHPRILDNVKKVDSEHISAKPAILSALGISPPSVTVEKKSDLPIHSSPNKSADILLSQSFKAADSKIRDNLSSSELQFHGPKSLTTSSTAKPFPSRDSRRRRSATGIIDPLGIFSTPTEAHDTVAVSSQVQPVTAGDHGTLFSASGVRSSNRGSVKDHESWRLGGATDLPDAQPLSFIKTTEQTETNVSQDQNLPPWLGGTGDGQLSQAKPTPQSGPPQDVKSPSWPVTGNSVPVSPSLPTLRTSDKVESKSVPDNPVQSWLGGSRQMPVSQSMATLQAADRVQGDYGTIVDGNLLKLVLGTSMEQQTAAALERQELQLAAALHLKHHEDRLSALLSRQQVMIQRQDEQLQMLVERQLERQGIMEQQMQEQQNRITAHISTLTSQPGPPAVVVEPVSTEKTHNEQTVKTLESENSHLRSTLEILQKKNSEEIEWVKDSYKHQIEILESALQEQESRFKNQCASITHEYDARLLRLEEEIKSLQKQHAEKVVSLQAEHAAQIAHLREGHNTTIEEFKKHQASLLEHLTSCWKTQRASLQVSQETAMLPSILKEMTECKQAIAEIHQRTQSVLQMGETTSRLTDIQDKLTKQKAATDEKHAKFLSLISTLEHELNQQRLQFEEDRRGLRDDIARLEKEKSSTLEHMKKEHEEDQKLKENTLTISNKERAIMEETKIWLAAEKSRLETLSRLQDDGRKAIDIERVEVESALQVAREAVRRADEDREKLLVERQNVTQEKRRLEHLKLNLGRKAQDLDGLTQLALVTKKEADKAFEYAAQQEREQTTRALNLQKQAEALQERERKLAEEKMLMSQERIGLQSIVPQRSISWNMSKSSDKVIVDPRLVIMKLQTNPDSSLVDLDSHYISSYMSVSK